MEFTVTFNRRFEEAGEITFLAKEIIDASPSPVMRRITGLKVQYNDTQNKAVLRFT